MNKCSVPHDRKISGGRRSEGVGESGNPKQVRERARVQDGRVEAAPVMRRSQLEMEEGKSQSKPA